MNRFPSFILISSVLLFLAIPIPAHSITEEAQEMKPYPANQWQGGVLDPSLVKTSLESVRWSHADSDQITLASEESLDWSDWSAMRFWLHSEKATGSSFMLLLFSEDEKNEGIDYYSLKITLNWTGWREFLVPFRELGITRDPVGFHKIDIVCFTATGWGNVPDPEAVVHLDGFHLLKITIEEPVFTDEDFFGKLDYSQPALAPIRDAVSQSNLAEAKRLLALHIKNRTYPKWFFDWRDHPMHGVTAPPREADVSPDQWDYYLHKITIDWKGWKKFRLDKAAFETQADVERDSNVQKQSKNPIGWHWIRNMTFSATGWSLNPDFETTLYFDDVRLVSKTDSMKVEDFESESLKMTGLERTTKRKKQGKHSGKWELLPLRGRVSCSQIPHDWTDVEALEFWLYSEKATGAQIVLVLDSDLPGVNSTAENTLAKKFSWNYGNRDWSVQFEDKVDWAINPTTGPDKTHLWNESLNRHRFFVDVAQAYWDTGDEKYAEGLVDLWMDWIRSNPRPYLTSGNQAPGGNYAWQTLTTAIRIEHVWLDALYKILISPAVTDEVLFAILRSIWEQADHLMKWPSKGNWLTEECCGLFAAGMMFPEFTDAAVWRATAIEKLYAQLDEEVYPDGMQVELAAGYNNWVVNNMTAILERAEMNQLRKELPKDFQEKIEKMYDYLLSALMPDGRIPGLNDSGNTNVRSMLAKGYLLFPHRKDFLFGASSGKVGKQPSRTSIGLHYTGHYIMRSGWDADAVYMLLDSAPLGLGHDHEDKLHFVLFAYGKQLVLDPGNYSYDRSKWRRYILDTPGHNTIMVDGLGQNRRRDRANRVWSKPWDQPIHPDNDTIWATDDKTDYVCGFYREGYGPEPVLDVTHTRKVWFMKPDYFIIEDILTPSDDQPHTYESLFHLDAPSATAELETGVVITQNPDSANLAIVPLVVDGLKVSIVKGQEDPVQGWANHPWRAIPTAIYTINGAGEQRFVTVLYPMRKGESCPIESLEDMIIEKDGEAKRALKIKFLSGKSVTVSLEGFAF